METFKLFGYLIAFDMFFHIRPWEKVINNEFVLISGFGVSYFGQKAFTKHLPYGPNAIVLVSSGIAVALAYTGVSRQSDICQKAWMAQEDKHTFLSPIDSKTNEETSWVLWSVIYFLFKGQNNLICYTSFGISIKWFGLKVF